MIADFANILAYHDDSRTVSKTDAWRTVSLRELLTGDGQEIVRWPVRNREERTEISSQKRAIIHERDGGICRYCAKTGMLVVDHIVPRSAFLAGDLEVADRSDNLHSACWGCNEARSNYETGFRKRLGVTAACFYCLHPEHCSEYSDGEPLPYPVNILAFCGRCGISNVPSMDCIL